jgi:hypothetical protein
MRVLHRLVREGPSGAPGPLVDALGRIGLVGYGLVHLLVAWLALQIARGQGSGPADTDGAVGAIGRSPGGAVVLLVVVVDYLTGQVGGTTASSRAADVLAAPAGRILLGVAAVVILAVAGGMVYTGVRRTFMGDLDVRRLPRATRRTIEVLGAVGTLARALALTVVGVLVGTAALMSDPERAGGLDAALRALGSTVLDTSLLVMVAAGFGAYGVYCLVDAATRRA